MSIKEEYIQYPDNIFPELQVGDTIIRKENSERIIISIINEKAIDGYFVYVNTGCYEMWLNNKLLLDLRK